MKKTFLLLFFIINSIVSAKTYYVATIGNNSNTGTLTQPWLTWEKAFHTALAGDTVYFRGGVYPMNVTDGSGIMIDSRYPATLGHEGTRSNPICYFNYPGETPILDCSNVTKSSGFSFGIRVWFTDFLHFRGLTVRNIYQKGSIVIIYGISIDYGSNNIILENMTVHDVSGVSFLLSSNGADSIYVNNCDAYNACDSIHEYAPGQNGVGYEAYNVTNDGFYVEIDSSRAWHCSDNAFAGRPFGHFKISNSWAFDNGSLNGEGIGYKISGINESYRENPPIQRTLINSVAVYNNAYGIETNDNNIHMARMAVYNNTSYKNGYGVRILNSIEDATTELLRVYKNNICYDNTTNVLAAGSYSHIYNSWDTPSGVTLTNADFVSVDSTGISAKRQPDGLLPDNDCYKYFLKLASTSDLIDAGIDVGLTYNGNAPDLGSFETGSASITPSIPLYLSSIIENSNPARLEMTYSLTLTNIIPATSAFSVRVNSTTRSVNLVSISDTKVLLTLASPVVYGDVVTVAYTKPASNPLQTTSGGQAASVAAQNVMNNVAAINPVYLTSVIENATPSRLEMTYNLTLANIIPAASAFSVRVNSTTRSVNSVVISGTKVLLTLSSPVVYGDAVTVAYIKPASNPLQTTSGGQAASVVAQNVMNNVAAISPVYLNSVIENATPTRLEMTYNLSLATITPAASAFSVSVNSTARTVSSVSVSGTKVLLILASPVVYGDVVTCAYTKPASNPLQTTSGAQAASIAAQNVTNNVAAIIPVYVSSVIENATPSRLEMTYNLSLATITPAASAFSVSVNSTARTVSSVSVSGTKVLLTLASPVVYGDAVTVAYTKPSSNPLQATSGGQSATLTARSVTNNCSPAANLPPVVNLSSPTKSTSYISPATITIDALASDPNGTISKVEFYQGTVKLGERTSAPYSYVWKEVPEGTYTIIAAATDNQNLRSVSAAVSVVVEKSATVVNQLPVVSITTPGNSKKYKKNDKILFEAIASDPDGSITKVEFKNGSTTLTEMTTAPYIYTWEAVDTGTFLITVIATDNLGASSESFNLEFIVDLVYDANSEIINLYPNPTDGHFTIDLLPGFTEQSNIITIVSLTGKTVYNDVLADGEHATEIDLSYIAPGAYVFMLKNGRNIVTTKKFIKK